jgi:hypothetical protein
VPLSISVSEATEATSQDSNLEAIDDELCGDIKPDYENYDHNARPLLIFSLFR